MLWLKALHIIAMVAWFAGLFYLPRLFVYHADCMDALGRERFVVMERRLYRAIMQPAMAMTLASGVGLLAAYAWDAYAAQGWLLTKLGMVGVLLAYHFWLGRTVRAFAAGRAPHGARFYRIINEVPTVLLAGIVILVVVKPF